MVARLPLVLFVLLWSSGYVVGAIGVDAAPPLGLLTLRFALALLLVVPLALRSEGWRRAPLGRLAVIGLLLQAVQFAGVYGGLSLGVHPGLSALVVLGLTPVATTAIAAAAGMERPTVRRCLALAAGVAGVALSLAPAVGGARVGAGIGLTLLGMLGLAGGTVLQKRWVAVADPFVTVAVGIAAAVLVVAPLAALAGQLELHPSADLAWSVAWLAWPLSVGATALFVTLLSRHAASTVSALLLLVPGVTAVMSALTRGDRLHPLSLVGMAVTMAALMPVVRGTAAAPVRPRRTLATVPRRC